MGRQPAGRCGPRRLGVASKRSSGPSAKRCVHEPDGAKAARAYLCLGAVAGSSARRVPNFFINPLKGKADAPRSRAAIGPSVATRKK
jgi:hypothetical protein